MLAVVNPCGFAMLPAYLSYFVGIEDAKARSTRASVVRAFTVGLSVAAGFCAVFMAAGLAIRQLALPVEEYSPWVSIVIGIVLVVIGIALLRGYELTLKLPVMTRGTKGTGIGSMVLFGASYATVSIGCTIPTFIGAVAGTFKRSNLASGVAVFIAFSLGMAVVLLALTVALALARQSLVRLLRRSGRYVNRVAGAMLVLAGAYVAYYGVYELRAYRGSSIASGPVDVVTGWSNDISTWVNDTGPVRIGVILSLGLVVIALIAYGVRARRASS
jgi:cytochrome c biogenesis protein CcdA